MSAVVLFDGVCNLCNASVAFILKRDPKSYFRFASLQSETAAKLLESHHVSMAGQDSVLLVEGGRVYTKSAAALRIARRLRGLWPIFYGFILMPSWMRDPCYDFIARRRYRWFGRRESCLVPSPEWRDRFLS